MRLSYGKQSLRRSPEASESLAFVPLEQPGQITSASHAQALGHPRHGHGGLGTQLQCEFNLGRMPLRPAAEFVLSPTEALKTSGDQSLRAHFHRLLYRLTEMARARSRVNLFEQFLPELLVAQIPATLQAINFRFGVLTPAPFQVLVKDLPASRGCPWVCPIPQAADPRAARGAVEQASGRVESGSRGSLKAAARQ